MAAGRQEIRHRVPGPPFALSARELSSRWIATLTMPIDAASIAVFRMFFGLILLWEVGRFFSHGWITEDYVEPTYYFGFLPYVHPWPGDGMYWHFFAMGVLAAMIAVGLFYRFAAGLFFLAFTYVFLLDKTQYQNHFYLICLVSALLALLPAHRAWSLDRVLGRIRGDETVPRWGLYALRMQIVLVYVFGGIAKLNDDWLRGEPLGTWLLDLADLPIGGPLFALPFAGVAFAWSGLLIDLTVGFLLLARRTFCLGALLATAFHLLNAQLFTIGIFPYFMLATIGLFPAPDWPRALLERVTGTDVRRDGATRGPIAPPSGRRLESGVALLALLHVYFLVQFALPLRHWLYPGDVSWTEEGHRFSWRMKLRDKDVVEFTMTRIDPRTGEAHTVDPDEYLTPRQVRKMTPRPDMIHQFARSLADDYEATHGVRPRITVRVRASLNGGPAEDLIDPRADLAARAPSLYHDEWIVPRE
jgi:vitamin K-dependent gamma-carboxylase